MSAVAFRLVLLLPGGAGAVPAGRLERLLAARGAGFEALPAGPPGEGPAELQERLLEALARHGVEAGEALLLAARYREEVLPAAGIGLLALLPRSCPPAPGETAFLGTGPAPRWSGPSRLLAMLDLLERLPPREPRRPQPRPGRPRAAGPAEARAAASVVLHDGAGRLFFVRRAEIPGSIAPGSWAFPGGMVDETDLPRGEADPGPLLLAAYRGSGARPGQLAALAAAARRELREETGLELGASRLLPLGRLLAPPYVPRRVETAYFLARYPEGERLRLSPEELAEARWLRPREALAGYREGRLFMTLPTLAALAPLVTLAAAGADRLEAETVRRPGGLIRPGSEVEWALRLLPPQESRT
ncbi:MAG: NUDIX hydrolase [Firmicutes bacterium]|nr:NUDIX hydrolase [Bacillota bacterium]